MAKDSKLIISIIKGQPTVVSWFWKKIDPTGFTTFNITNSSALTIYNGEYPLLNIKMDYEKNRLYWDGENGEARLYALIEDVEDIPAGDYTYTIRVNSLIDDSKIEDFGEVEIRDA